MSALDWSGRGGAPLATIGNLAPCQHCGRPAMLRHPENGLPCHKVCEEAAVDAATPPAPKSPLSAAVTLSGASRVTPAAGGGATPEIMP